ncbi:hypothetical protein JVU11DRAFT_10680 [Chiua virens]|nr:hypothetical protein JVU11DRAFT_10680 [Chiua virens]
MSLYCQQIKLLSHLLQDKKHIEILMADRSQGRDKDCHYFDGAVQRLKQCTSTTLLFYVGDLLKDWRRVNVSFTRAQSKLIILGSRRMLCGTPLLAEFLQLMDERGWILQLGEGAESMHPVVAPPRVAVVGKQGGKRGGENGDGNGVGMPPKKLRTPMARDGVLRGWPILQDVVNGELCQ